MLVAHSLCFKRHQYDIDFASINHHNFYNVRNHHNRFNGPVA
jgi:hypothetical protein